MESNIGDGVYVCYFVLVGENLVGQRYFVGDIDVIVDFYVMDVSY